MLLPTLDGNTQGNQAIALGGGRGMLWGHPVATTTNLTHSTASGVDADLIFGNWRDVLVAGWGPLTIEVSENYGTDFKKRRLLVLMTQLLDIGLRHPEAFEIATNLDTTLLV